MNVSGITNHDMSATINGAVKAGWVYIGSRKNHTAGQIQWPPTGAVVSFSTTPKAGSWKTTAQMIYAESGVDLRRKGSTRRSRKSPRAKVDPQVEASRRRHAALAAKHEAAREAAAAKAAADRAAEYRRRYLATRAADDDRRRRDIEELMRR